MRIRSRLLTKSFRTPAKRPQYQHARPRLQILEDRIAPAFSNGSQLRIFRIAIASTVEFTALNGGTAGTSTAINKAVAGLNEVYGKELSINFVLVPNNNNLIFTTTDNFTSGKRENLYLESQSVITSIIGSSNFDIGQVFDSGYDGGFAHEGVGVASQQGLGTSGRTIAVVDSAGKLDSDFRHFFAHEVGHQFSAGHTFNAKGGPDLQSEYNAGSAYEPGLGSTLMSYALYNDPADNFATAFSETMHIHTLDQITTYINNVIPNVGTKQATGNAIPFINGGFDYTIPTNTPFVLSGTGSDPTDPLTYTWEQYDLATHPTALGTPDSGYGPLYRSFEPTATGNVRLFPALETVLAGQTGSKAEVAATTNRHLNFLLTVRDGKGAYQADNVDITTVDTGAGFAITNFNLFQQVYAQTTQTVTWNVAGTTGNGINVSKVSIDFSKDGGQTFTTLNGNEDNDGSAAVFLPANSVGEGGRFRIRANGNIFYDINNADFKINAVPTTLLVQNAGDGLGSLRLAIDDSNNFPGVQTIKFDPTYFSTPRTIVLNGQLSITDAVTIEGPGSGFVTVSGNNTSRIFNTAGASPGTVITLRGLTMAAGNGTDGGGIYSEDETLIMDQSVISNCSASGDGGAINMQFAGRLELTRSTISGNTAADDGGGIYFNQNGSVSLSQSTLSNNKALNGTGGGLYFFGSVSANGLSIYNCTISGNSAAVGGGGILLNAFSGTLDIQHSTITGNYTFNSLGGGIARSAGSGTISLDSSIVSGNTAAFCPDVFSDGTVNVNYSAIGSTSGFTLTGAHNLIGQNLKLRPLASNGGLTQTVAFEYDSPLHDAGKMSVGYSFDQRSVFRAAGGVTDIGAFELHTYVNDTDDVTGNDSLREAIVESNRVAGPDIITFGSKFNTSQTITLFGGELAITDAVTIAGPGASLVQISGNNNSRIFNISAVPTTGKVTLRNMTLTAGNGTEGGAIYSEDEYLTVEDSVISNSSATVDGGAINIEYAGTLTLLRSTLSGNVAGDDGGAIYFRASGSAKIESSTIANNKASTGIGGGLYFFGAVGSGGLTVINSTIVANTASLGGGGIVLPNFVGTLNVINSTITANEVTNSSGGGIVRPSGSGTISIQSSIVSGNGSFIPDVFSSGTVNVNDSAIGSAAGFTLTGSNNIIGQNLKLGALGNNGGPTPTILPAVDSPVINKGSNSAGLATDQRGVARTLFGATDIGSVEVANVPDTTAPTITLITSDTPNGTYGPGSVIDIRVNFSEPVTLTGTLDVMFDNGGVGVITAQQSGMTTLTGSYHVVAGQPSPDLNVSAFTLESGSTLRDASNNNALLTLPASNFGVNKDIVITTPDTSAPTITSITSPTPNGTYGAGATIGVSLNFSEPVTLSGYLFVFLNTGGSLLIQGPQTGTTLSGTYTVGFNQNSTDLNVTAVQLDSSSFITDSASNQAVLTLPANNLANSSNIVISTPTTPTFTVTNTNNSGAGSLRQAVLDANNTSGFQNIAFDSSFNSAKTITLTSGELSILDGVSITGPGANLLTINGNQAGRVFNIASGSAVTISGVGITGGEASLGGGIYIGANRPLLTLVDVHLFNNVGYSQGGGIWIGDSTNFTITRSTISGNSASSNGGGLYAQFSTSTIADSAIVNNTCTFGSGGGFFSYGGVTVTNTTISGNSAASSGGGIATGSISLRNSTIVNNTGGGVARTFGNGTITVESSIVSGNSGTDISSGGTVNVNFSAIGSNAGFTLTGSNNLPFGTNLKLASLTANGGPTLSHLPAPDSPLVNAGSNPAGLATDQRGSGFPRVLNGQTDIGAVEVVAAPPSLVVSNINDSGAGSLRQAIINANSLSGPNTITFDATFFSTPRTITLAGTQMVLTDASGTTTITGPGMNLVTINGNNLSRVFQVNSGVTVAMTGMTISGGKNSGDGGGVYNVGTLTLSNSKVSGNTATNIGGGIYSAGTLTLTGTTWDGNVAYLGAAVQSNGNLTVSGSTFSNNKSSFLGGALRLFGSASITSSTLSNNSATNAGGAIINHATTTLSNCTVANNSATDSGGGIHNFGTLIIGDSTFSNNSSAAGGGICSPGTVTINNTQFTSNKADFGGAIKNDGTITISGSAFNQNVADITNGWGGAIWNNAPLTITQCTFTSNHAKTYGGAVISFTSLNIANSTFTNNISDLNGGALRLDGSATITASTFNGNTAANGGGAIISHGTTTIDNSTVANNSAHDGGGIMFFDGTATIRNLTVAYNTAVGSGGGTTDNYASVTTINTIIAGNAAPDQANVWGAAFAAGSSNNLLNVSAAAAGLNTLANNGGPTQTIALLPGSPAINAGISVGLTTDQRGAGFNRINSGASDIGAFESKLPPTVTSVVFGDGAAQRSMVKQVVVTFSEPVSFSGGNVAAAFTLSRTGSGGTLGNVQLSTTSTSPTSIVTLTFAGSLTEFGSLVDGIYDFIVSAAQVSAPGGALDGNVDGIPGGSYFIHGTTANKFFRLFGDQNADVTVDQTDYLVFRNALSAGASTIFDFDHSGDVDQVDYLKFRNRIAASP
ncbi:MAG: choice-of-anchor Q domain-containing protein [Gemmataceae bacterium]